MYGYEGRMRGWERCELFFTQPIRYCSTQLFSSNTLTWRMTWEKLAEFRRLSKTYNDWIFRYWILHSNDNNVWQEGGVMYVTGYDGEGVIGVVVVVEVWLARIRPCCSIKLMSGFWRFETGKRTSQKVEKMEIGSRSSRSRKSKRVCERDPWEWIVLDSLFEFVFVSWCDPVFFLHCYGPGAVG